MEKGKKDHKILRQETNVEQALSMRILLVEDVEINRWLFQEFLEIKGYIVCSLPDGLNFFQTIAEFKPNLILLDLKLPQIDGFTLLQQLQDLPSYRSIPVVIVSAYGFEQEKKRALSLGVRSYLTKPVMLEKLAEVVAIECDRPTA